MSEQAAVAAVVSPDVTAPEVETPETQEEPNEGSPEPKAKPSAREKIKVDGEEEELDIEELKAWAQKGRSSHKRYQEAAQLKKDAEDRTKQWEDDPYAALKASSSKNPKIREAAEKWLWDQVQQEQLPPAVKEKMALEEENKKLKADAEDHKKKQDEDKKAKDTEEWRQRYDQDFTKALNTSGLPRNPQTIARVAKYVYDSLDTDSPMDVAEAIELVRNDYVDDIKQMLGNVDEKSLLKLLGDDISGKLRKADLARIKNPESPKVPRFNPQSEPVEDKGPKYLTSEEFKKSIEEDVKKVFRRG